MYSNLSAARRKRAVSWFIDGKYRHWELMLETQGGRAGVGFQASPDSRYSLLDSLPSRIL